MYNIQMQSNLVPTLSDGATTRVIETQECRRILARGGQEEKLVFDPADFS